jgi:DNA-binding PadR family transcriptional regulator
MYMSTAYPLLGLLQQKPRYGYDLKKTYDAVFGQEKPLAFGQVYDTLRRMLRDRQITEESIEQQGGPVRKRYAITPTGRSELEEWLGKPEPTPGMQTVLFVKVATAILLDKSPEVFLDAQRKAHLQKMRELTRLRREGNLSQALRADYALFHLEADLRWIDVTVARINELAKEIYHEG